MRHVFIINPAAGKGRALELIPVIENYFKGTHHKYVLKITEYPGHATKIAREYAESEICRIYSIGGDGTVNEIVNGIAGTRASLGVIPAGSGNDFIRSIHGEYKAKEIVSETISGEERSLDLARANGKYFINISSIGFDADIVYNARKFKRLPYIPGRMAYLFSLIYTTFKNKINEVKVTIDDNEEFDLKILLAAVANGRFYGGGMLPVPDAVLDDGFLDVCLVREVSRFKILTLFPKYIKGEHGQLEYVSFKRAKKIKIESKDTIALNIDGEILTGKEIEFEILKGAINVIYPVGMTTNESVVNI
ncbi:diacylglycerol/lipid kinase family protein [Ruminiclostridium josui]|uniref:diacylglycerol/lipid kinase family protein n=1 Tax=Ruminiclostridium josui TaxID=1499 RepID=UPI0004652B5E|nr:diacylglycerol kinase family protein [Ruminiclostridium josui]